MQYANLSKLVGGLNGTSSVFRNTTTATFGSNGTVGSSSRLTATYVGASLNTAGLIEIPWVCDGIEGGGY